MNLPFSPPLDPMLAQIGETVPEEGRWLFEPKWDGFRAIVFRDGQELLIQSRDHRPLERFFPELVAPLLRDLPRRCVVDGEVILLGPQGLDFEALQLRLHPAESRIEKLARETPAGYVAFDLLALGDRDLRGEPQEARRAALEDALGGVQAPLLVTPATRSREVARDWFDRLEGAGFEGLIAKPLDLAYQPKKRALLKIKHVRTVDCVVAGFRWHKNGPGELVGSLLLGLYDDDGVLHHVGITSSFKMTYRRELARRLEPLREGASESHPWLGEWAAAGNHGRRPAGSRWNPQKSLSWEPLRPELVVEVKFDYLQGGRFRHAATFLHWREDKLPEECTYDQIEEPSPLDLSEFLRASGVGR
ncbi:MAG TPA: ATP-dependent DNA ligase [Thermoanaerobaculia bacterium]|nr:ATP-dependent DNA ligase [Thermoanaerobaculia bacterium]